MVSHLEDLSLCMSKSSQLDEDDQRDLSNRMTLKRLNLDVCANSGLLRTLSQYLQTETLRILVAAPLASIDYDRLHKAFGVSAIQVEAYDAPREIQSWMSTGRSVAAINTLTFKIWEMEFDLLDNLPNALEHLKIEMKMHELPPPDNFWVFSCLKFLRDKSWLPNLKSLELKHINTGVEATPAPLYNVSRALRKAAEERSVKLDLAGMGRDVARMMREG